MASGNNTDSRDDYGRVYRAVAAGASREEVQRVLEACAQGSAERRAAAADAAGEHEGKHETPLAAAHRLRHGDLVGLLLEAGADVKLMFNNPRTSALAVCIAYGQVDSLRALLRSGRADANERVAYGYASHISGEILDTCMCTAAHLCIQPPRLSLHSFLHFSPPQLACLEVLVREFGADVNARDQLGGTPLKWFVPGRDHQENAIDLLVQLGADVNARDNTGETPIFTYASGAEDLPAVRLLAHGASADVFDSRGRSPLLTACFYGKSRGVIELLLRHSPPRARRAVYSHIGCSAVDCLAEKRPSGPLESCRERVIAELLASGAPVLPENATFVLPIAASLMARQHLELTAWSSPSSFSSWRAHEAMVGLALDAREAREVGDAVESAQQRVEALEEELRELGCGTESDSESDGEGEGEEKGEGGSGSEAGSGGG